MRARIPRSLVFIAGPAPSLPLVIAIVFAGVLAMEGCRLDRAGLGGAGGIAIGKTGEGGVGGGGGIAGDDAAAGAGGADIGPGGPGAPDADVDDAGPDDAEPPDAGPRPCGGGLGACPSLRQFCERPDGVCDGEGVCVPVPPVGACATTGPRVCGCDDHVYLNDCFREQARVSKLKNGGCN